MNIRMEFIEEDFLEAMDATEEHAQRNVLLLMEAIGLRTIAYLRSHTSTLRPPARASRGRRAGSKMRRAHPGGWADVTSQLANSYGFEIRAAGQRVRWSRDTSAADGSVQPVSVVGNIPTNPRPPFELVLFNVAEYAIHLENRDGYFVISGVTQDGGPVQSALTKIAAQFGFDIRMGGFRGGVS